MEIEPVYTLILSILVLYIGIKVNENITVLSKYYIPPSVTGGIICSLMVATVYFYFETDLTFDMQIRDLLLLVFFSTVGLSAKFRTLAAGGKAIAILTIASAVFLVVQDITGVLFAKGFGVHPGYGLMGGSVSFAGGHGTAIAWGKEATAAGLENAATIGLAFATFGLVAGGVLGGPVGRFLLTRYDLHPKAIEEADTAAEVIEPSVSEGKPADPLAQIMLVILILSTCVALGDLVNRFLFEQKILLPGFLTSMFVGIAITNVSDIVHFELPETILDHFSKVSLNIFLAMSLMSMKLVSVVDSFGEIMVVLMAQTLVMTLFAILIVFRIMGRDYDAAVISTGFVGLGLGATPVAIANMSTVTSQFGPSPKAFIVVPLVGAFFIDILNATVIKLFIGMF